MLPVAETVEIHNGFTDDTIVDKGEEKFFDGLTDIPLDPPAEIAETIQIFSEETKSFAKVTSPSLAKKLTLSPDLTEEQRLEWVLVCAYLDSLKAESKYYKAIANSSVKGKVLTDDIILEICKLIESVD